MQIGYTPLIMPKGTAIILLALFVAIMPFLGFPSAWKTFFYVGAGLILAALSYLDKKELLAALEKQEKDRVDVFVQNSEHHEEPENHTPLKA
jgi:cell division protein FtsW (lipid II flippase)